MLLNLCCHHLLCTPLTAHLCSFYYALSIVKQGTTLPPRGWSKSASSISGQIHNPCYPHEHVSSVTLSNPLQPLPQIKHIQMLLSHQQHLTQASSPIRAIALPLEFAEVYSIYTGSLSTNHEHSELYLPMQDPEDQRAEDSMHPTRAYRGKRGRKTSSMRENINPTGWTTPCQSPFFLQIVSLFYPLVKMNEAHPTWIDGGQSKNVWKPAVHRLIWRILK